MLNLIESSEFGDWLVGEISKAGAQARAADFERALAAKQRQERLKVAKKVLLEFLTLQQAMLEAAAAVRRHRPLRNTCHGAEQPMQTADIQHHPD